MFATQARALKDIAPTSETTTTTQRYPGTPGGGGGGGGGSAPSRGGQREPAARAARITSGESSTSGALRPYLKNKIRHRHDRRVRAQRRVPGPPVHATALDLMVGSDTSKGSAIAAGTDPQRARSTASST